MKKIRRQEKILSAVMLAVLILFTITPAGYLFIHAFDAPDGWGFRFSFVYCFLFCTMGCRVSAHWKELKPLGIILSSILNSAVYLSMVFWQNHRMQDWMYSSNTYQYALVNVAVLFLWTGYYFLCRKFGDDFKNRNAVIALGLLLTVTESVYSGWLSYYKSPEFYPGVSEDNYFAWRDNLTNALDEIEEESNPETEFYRISTVNNILYNSDTYMGYNGVSDFGTTENYKTRKSLEKIGYYSSPRFMPEYGLSPVSAMLLGVKYEIDVMDIYQWNRIKETPDIRKNDTNLQVGFMVNADLEEFTFEGGDAFKNSNDLLTVMTGETIEVYSREDHVEIVEDGIHLRQGYQQLVLDGDGSKDEMTITYRIPADERLAYCQFYYGDSRLIAGMPYFYGGAENNILGDGHFGVSYIKTMEKDEEGYYVTIGMNRDSIQSVYYEQANFYYYNETELQKAYDILSKNQWELDKIRNGNLCGKIISEEDKQLMFISVPYEKGWEAYIDGEKTTILPVMEDGFMAIALEEAGEHRIEIKYKVPGLMPGKIISMIAVLFFALLCFKTRKN